MNLKLFILTTFLLVLGCSADGNNVNNIKDEIASQTEIKLKSAPELLVSASEVSVKARIGSYSWGYKNKDGTHTGIEASAMGPPLIVQNQVPLTVERNEELSLNFEIAPLRYQVRTWDGENNLTGEYKEIDLSRHEGIIIFEILAYFEQGTVSYAFLVNVEKD